MDTLCYALLAGYPVVGGAIATLWVAYQKSQTALLAEKGQRVRELEALRDLLTGGGRP
jgi:hypothetical protein